MITLESAAAVDEANSRSPKSAREALGAVPSFILVSLAAASFTVAWAIALLAPSWWLAGLLAFVIGATALSGAIDQRIADLQARDVTNRALVLGPYVMLRLVSAGLAIAAIAAFVILGVGLAMGSLGPGG